MYSLKPSVKFALIFFALLFHLNGKGQEIIHEFTESSSEKNVAYSVVGNSIFLYNSHKYNWHSDVWLYDQQTNQLDKVDSLIYHINSGSYSYFNKLFSVGNGVYYPSSEYGPTNKDYYLNFMDTLGNKSSFQFGNSDQLEVHDIFTFKSRCYLNVKDGNIYKLLENDAGQFQNDVVFQSNFPIEPGVFEFNDTLVFCVNTGAVLEMYKYAQGSSPVLLKSFLDASYAGKAGSDDDYVYFNVGQTSNIKNVWRTDLTEIGTTIFLDSLSIEKIEFYDSTFIFSSTQQSSINNQYLFQGDKTHPNDYTLIPYEYSLNQTNVLSDNWLGKGFFRTMTHEKGIELGTISPNNLIGLSRDFNIGPNSGLVLNETDLGEISHYYFPHFLDTDSTLYTLMSNGNDIYPYIYKIKDSTYTSLIRLDYNTLFHSLHKANNHLYWFTVRNGKLSYNRFNLNDPIDLQPLTLPENDEWHRDIVLCNIGSFWEYDTWNYKDYCIGVKFNQQNELITGFYTRDLENDLISSYDTTLIRQIGNNVFAKYDNLGKCQWIKTFGGDHMLTNVPEFELDNNGDVIILSYFYENCLFETDSMSAEKAGYFLAKLDGQTGDLIWKKLISSTTFIDDIMIDGIEIDNDNQIYITVLYRDFILKLEGLQIESELNPSNAVGKFDSNGNIIWLKNMFTPWTDMYGRTFITELDKNTNELFSFQSQGNYKLNSSCNYMHWKYYLQRHDGNGDLQIANHFVGTDLGAVTTGNLDGNGHLIGYGFFRDKIQLGRFEIQSEPTSECYENLCFRFEYNKSYNELIKVQSTVSPFYPLDSEITDNYQFVLGTDKDNELHIIKFDKNGEELGYKKLHQQTDPFDYGQDVYFSANDEYIAITGKDFKYDSTYKVASLNQHNFTFSTLKIRNENWESNFKWFENVELILPSESSDVLVYPNPFDDDLTIVMSDSSDLYDHYEIIDLNGRIIKKQELNFENYNHIDGSYLSNGVYLIRIYGNSSEIIRKIIKR